jgi:ABC-type phosphate/phosphonate transport system substrate-binding protein
MKPKKLWRLMTGTMAFGAALCIFSGAAMSGATPTIKLGVLPANQPEEMVKRFTSLIDYLLTGDTPMAYLAPVTISRARYHSKHDPVPEFPIALNTRYLDPEVQKKILSAPLTMHEKDLPALKAIDPKYERWVKIAWKDYQPVKETIDKVHGAKFYTLKE